MTSILWARANNQWEMEETPPLIEVSLYSQVFFCVRVYKSVDLLYCNSVLKSIHDMFCKWSGKRAPERALSLYKK